jgi:hypothetical protein
MMFYILLFLAIIISVFIIIIIRRDTTFRLFLDLDVEEAGRPGDLGHLDASGPDRALPAGARLDRPSGQDVGTTRIALFAAGWIANAAW